MTTSIQPLEPVVLIKHVPTCLMMLCVLYILTVYIIETKSILMLLSTNIFTYHIQQML